MGSSVQSTHSLFQGLPLKHGFFNCCQSRNLGFYHLSGGVEGKHPPKGMPALLSADARAHALRSGHSAPHIHLPQWLHASVELI